MRSVGKYGLQDAALVYWVFADEGAQRNGVDDRRKSALEAFEQGKRHWKAKEDGKGTDGTYECSTVVAVPRA